MRARVRACRFRGGRVGWARGPPRALVLWGPPSDLARIARITADQLSHLHRFLINVVCPMDTRASVAPEMPVTVRSPLLQTPQSCGWGLKILLLKDFLKTFAKAYS